MLLTDLERWGVGLVVAAILALSGWAKVYFDHVGSKPKISGRLVSCMRGSFTSAGVTYASFMAYPYLYNLRKNSMNIYNYKLFVELEGKWHELDSIYGMETGGPVSFADTSGANMNVTDFLDNILYRKNPAIQNGIAVHGWLPFCGPKELYGKNVTKYKLVCIDATLNDHVIITNTETMHEPLLSRFAQIAGGIRIVHNKQ